MEIAHVLLLLALGGVAGLAGGLLGIGGGVIFTPTLFFYFSAVGVPDETLVPLSIGTGLLCTWVVGLSSASGHWKRGAVHARTAVVCSVAAIAATWGTSLWITTAPWFSPHLFQRVFAIFLTIVAFRMIWTHDAHPDSSISFKPDQPEPSRPVKPIVALTGGGLAGLVASSVGVGGGIVLVPLYERVLKMNIREAIGTSSASIVLITGAAVMGFIYLGIAGGTANSETGYVDLFRAALLSFPAAATARVGVALAHRINRVHLRQLFAALAILVALRLFLWG